MDRLGGQVMNNKILFILFSLFLFTASMDSFAGAAEKWEYDVTPDTDQKLKLKGHQVDAYGNAANDYEYNRKIDPKTAANRTKMGKVGFGRLLKISGWGLLGSAALEGLLEAVDWVIDPEAQSIWRYKKTGNVGLDCKNFGYKWQTAKGSVSSCPLDAARNAMQERIVEQPKLQSPELVQLCTDSTCAVLISTLPDNATIGSIFVKFRAIYEPTGTYVDLGETLKRGEKVEDTRVKEELTPDELADYANHTHPDYANPDLAPKLEPHYTPSIQTDLWKPANPWEYDNSPTVDEVKKELEQASPEPKDDKIKENEPDPETGGKSFSLPAFCSWAVSVCEFIDSFKDEPTLEDQTLDIEENNPLAYERQNYVQFGQSCPFSPKQYVLPLGIGSIEFEADASILCEYGSIARPFIIGLGHLGCLIYLLYALRSGSA